MIEPTGIDVLERVEREATGPFGRVVAAPERHHAVAHLVADDRRHESRQEDHSVGVEVAAADPFGEHPAEDRQNSEPDKEIRSVVVQQRRPAPPTPGRPRRP